MHSKTWAWLKINTWVFKIPKYSIVHKVSQDRDGWECSPFLFLDNLF